MNNELTAKAKWVADLMKADGVRAEQVTHEMVMAYLDEVGRRIQTIQTTYLTRIGAREAMQAKVLSIA